MLLVEHKKNTHHLKLKNTKNKYTNEIGKQVNPQMQSMKGK